MFYDLFISYSRRDNAEGRIKQLVKRIENDFNSFAGRKLITFFDLDDIHGMEDWRHRILQGLRESRILLACLSPAYINSEYCEWEFNEYLKHEIGHAYFGEGVAPIYFVEVPGWNEKGFEQQCAEWVIELRRRHHFDLRPWYYAGEESLRDAVVKERMLKLNEQLKEQINRSEQEEHIPGNMDSHNLHFIGRTIELRRLREHFVNPGTIGAPIVLHGLGGVGKTALAIEYAHAFAPEYGGGRWQLRCEGKEVLFAVIAGLASPLAIEFSEEEKKDTYRQFERVLAELYKLAINNEKHHCLIILDNVDKPTLLKTHQTSQLPSDDWLHIIVTTRLGEQELPDFNDKKCFIPVDELPEADALALIETYQKDQIFSNDEEREAAREIVQLLGSFTLAVESAAVYLNQFNGNITCAKFLIRLKKEGILWDRRENPIDQKGVLHGERSLAITLAPTFELLNKPEKLFLKYSAYLPPDHIALQWIRILVAEKTPEFARDAEPGYPDLWTNLVRKLLSLRFLQLTNQKDPSGQLKVVKMHRIIGNLIRESLQVNHIPVSEIQDQLSIFLLKRAYEITQQPIDISIFWELDCLFNSVQLQLIRANNHAQLTATYCCSSLRNSGWYSLVVELAEYAISSRKDSIEEDNVSIAWFHNMAGSAYLYLANSTKAEEHFIVARDLTDQPGTDSIDKLDSLTNIGCLFRETNRPEESLKPSKKAYHLCKAKFGKNSPQYAKQCTNLGLVYQDLCKLDEAIPLFRKAIAIYKAHHNLVLDTCQDLSTLTEALRNASKTIEAWEAVNEALALVKSNGLEDHPASINILTNYAALLEEEGNLKEASIYYEKAYRLTIQCFGENSNHLSIRLNNLGVNSLLTGNYDLAIKQLQCALEFEKNNSILNNHKLAHRELNLGIAYLFANDLSAAKFHIESGWEYKLKTNIPNLISVRLLIVRLAIALISYENIDLVIGQLLYIMDKDILSASGTNIKWTLESKILELIRNCKNDQSRFLFLINDIFKTKILSGSVLDMENFKIFQRKNLTEKWDPINKLL